jgi:hypothetical protein
MGLCLSADGPDDRFIEIYNLIQTADQNQNPRTARQMYEQAQEKLRGMQRDYPIWNERVINYRLRYTADKLANLAKLPLPPESGGNGGVAATNPVPSAIAPSGEVITQFNELTQQIRLLQTDKQLLEAKLREALSAQPAPVDPREFQAAIERIATLQQTNKTLIANLQRQQSERANLVDKLVVEEAQNALQEANRQLAAQRQNSERLDQERAAAAAELKRLQEETVKPLRMEVSILKQQGLSNRPDGARLKQTTELSEKLARLEAGMEELKQQNELLVREKSGLEKQLEDFKTRSAEEGIVKIAQLETQLAVAKADSARQNALVEDISVKLSQEKQVRTELQTENQNLSQRVAALTATSAADIKVIQQLQETLAAEKSERTQVETELKNAEQKLRALQVAGVGAGVAPSVPTGPASPLPNAETPAEKAAREAQVQALEAEVGRLRDTVKTSTQREADLTQALAQERSLRERMETEKSELEKRLAGARVELAANRVERSRAEALRGDGNGLGAGRSTGELEARVRQLESEREELRLRLVRLTLNSRALLVRSKRAVSPRERASEFLQWRHAQAFSPASEPSSSVAPPTPGNRPNK